MRRRGNGLAWLGLGLGLLGVVTYFTWIALRLPPRVQFLRDTALLNLALVGVALGVSVEAIRHARSRAQGWPVLAPILGVLNLAVAVLFILMLYRFAALPAPPNAPQVGQAAPDFTLVDDTGSPLQLAALHGKNVLLVFYRGHW